MEQSFIRYFLCASLIPLAAIILYIVIGSVYTSRVIQGFFSEAAVEFSREAEKSLQQLGEEYIRTKARDVARQAEIYFSSHPHYDFNRMRKDPGFMSFALQKVGETGYTSMYEAQTWIFRIHPNQTLVDKDVSFLAKELPTWWHLVYNTKDGKEVAGYYDWRDPDGTIRKKFMAITPSRVKVKGRIIMVAATTYIDEFSAPVRAMHEKSRVLAERLRTYQREMLIYFLAVTGLFFLTILALAFLWGKRIAQGYIKPIVNLSETAKKLGGGNWDAPLDMESLKRPDEVGVMARSFHLMASSLQEAFAELAENMGRLRKTQEALKKSEVHYRSFFDGVPVGIFRSTPEGKFLDVNPALVKLLGFPDRETLLATPVIDLYVDPRKREEWTTFLESSRLGRAGELLLKRYDGRHIWVEVTARAVFGEGERVEYYEGSIMDVTERHEFLAALQKSQDRFRSLYEESRRAQEVYRSLINSSADAIVMANLEGEVTYVSPMFTKMFGWEEREIRNGKLPIIADEEREAHEISFLELVQTGEPIQGLESKGKTKDGRLIDISLSLSRYADHEGKPAGVLMIVRDISEAKALKRHLEQIEKLEALATLAGGIAHDFNNLLMVMEGIVSLLLHETPPHNPQYKLFSEIENQIQRGSRLTRQLLGYARRGKYEVKPLQINDLLRETAETLQRTRKDIRFQCYLSSDLPWVEADPSQMNQVFMNLLLNAADAMPEGGTITLETDVVTEQALPSSASNVRPGNYVRVMVADTGHGMDAKTLDRIFEPFFTTKPPGKGTGLGLSSVYGIVKSHGGHIHVTSKPLAGTTFYLYFPAVDRKEEARPASLPPLIKGKGTVLIVDDEKPVLEVCAAMLETLGYSTVKALSGEEAIRILERAVDEIDGVVLDMIMPDMAGPVVFERLRALRPDLKILISSGYAPDEKARQMLEKGGCSFIQKPFRLDELSERLSALFAQS